MKDTKIRWAEHSWNPMTGCSHVSPGCDHCYAETIAEKFRGSAFPAGFDPSWKPHKLGDPAKWPAARVFVNSMSDVHHPAFSDEQVGLVYDRMVEVNQHDYLVLTKRPTRMVRFLERWLDSRGLAEVPGHIWLGTSVESDGYVWRADRLREIPVPVRFLSCEPLLGPLPSLDLSGIAWLIVGGESGPGYRPMDHGWARDLRDRCRAGGVAFFFKQSAAFQTERGIELDGERIEEYPRPHPTLRHSAGGAGGGPAAACGHRPEGRVAASGVGSSG